MQLIIDHTLRTTDASHSKYPFCREVTQYSTSYLFCLRIPFQAQHLLLKHSLCRVENLYLHLCFLLCFPLLQPSEDTTHFHTPRPDKKWLWLPSMNSYSPARTQVKMSPPLEGLSRLPQAEEPLPALEPGASLHRPACTLSHDEVFAFWPPRHLPPPPITE